MSRNVTVRPNLLIGLLVVFFLSACEYNRVVDVKPGDEFPFPALEILVHNSKNSVSLRDKTLVINFWASWCAPCRKEMPELQRLSDALDKDKFMVIGVSIDEDKYLMQEFLLQQKIRFANYHDINQSLSSDVLAIQAYPETFIISPQGIIIKRIIGVQLWNRNSMHSLLKSIHQDETTEQSSWAF